MRLNNFKIGIVLAAILMLVLAPPASSKSAKIWPPKSDHTGSSCSPKHAIVVELASGGLHFGDRSYLDVTSDPFEGVWTIKAKVKKRAPRKVTICRLVIQSFDRVGDDGLLVRPKLQSRYPKRPGLGVYFKFRPSKPRPFNTWVFARLKR